MTAHGSVSYNSRPARFVAGLIVLLVGWFSLSGIPTPAAFATENNADSGQVGSIIITKLADSEEGTEPGTGLPVDVGEKQPLAGTKFQITRVPGIDPLTNEGQLAAGELTLNAAESLVKELPPTRSGTTNSAGELAFSGLELGLYYVEEVSAPAGYVNGRPFLVLLPLTNPETGRDLLYEVYVHPKNAAVDVTLSVNDADAVVLGDPVLWTGKTAVPSGSPFGSYRVEVTVGPHMNLVGDPAVTLRCGNARSCASLVAGKDYHVVSAGNGFTVEFTQAGRKKLEAAAGKGTHVEIKYTTLATSEGELESTISLHTGLGVKPVSASAITKWGPLGILVHEVGKPSAVIPGAKFKLYASLADAQAGRSPIIVAGVSEWTTDKDGRIWINGLRFSDFVNGQLRQPSDPLFREYYAVMTYIPDKWKGTSMPLPVLVDSVSEANVAVVELYLARPEPGPDPSPQPTPGPSPDPSPDPTPEPSPQPSPDSTPPSDGALPVTGAQVGAWAVIALAFTASGAALLRRHKREDQMPAVQSRET